MNAIHSATPTQNSITPALAVHGTPAVNPVRQALPTPQQLRQQLPVSTALVQRIQRQRHAVDAILQGHDPRLLVVVGPCSIHDPHAALEYAQRLADLSAQVDEHMLLAMRIYIEKPRTTVGWKGLLYDPHLDGSADMAAGLTLSRRLMLHAAELGLPVATELLQPLSAGYFADVLSWVAIGARTSESQIHRELVSSLPMATGFKNGTDGSVQVAVDAMRSAAHGHQYMGVDEQGQLALMQAAGNHNTHLVLRGGQHGSNYDAQSVAAASTVLQQTGVTPCIMVDCNHANSGKDPQRQPAILQDIMQQRQQGNRALRAVMIESHLFDGQQPLQEPLAYGVSITDACLGWEKTEQMLLAATRRL